MPEPTMSTRSSPFEELVRHFQPALLSYFRRRVGAGGEAEDLTQEVFVRMLRRGDVAAIADVRAYLFEIAASVLIDRQRRSKVRQLARHESFDPAAHGGEDFNSEETFMGEEALSRLSQALLDLPERTRTVFVLRRLEGLRYQDIARRLRITVSAVEKQMAKALAYLAARVNDE
jgi:RNA polymerase sigma factor (sigma-70 family)